MPKGRMLSKRISYDERVAHLSIDATLLFTWMIPHLDCEGRIYGTPEILKGTVVPFVQSLTIERIAECIDEIAATGLILVYGNGQTYLQFEGFYKNQSIAKHKEASSVIPEPTPELLRSNSRVSRPQIKSNQIKVNQINPAPTEPAKADIVNKAVDNYEKNQKVSIALDAINKDGFNIYALLSRAKVKVKQPAWKHVFADQVILALCDEYWKYKPKIKDAWPWFERVLVQKYTEWHANNQIAQNQEYKKTEVSPIIKDILKNMSIGSVDKRVK